MTAEMNERWNPIFVAVLAAMIEARRPTKADAEVQEDGAPRALHTTLTGDRLALLPIDKPSAISEVWWYRTGQLPRTSYVRGASMLDEHQSMYIKLDVWSGGVRVYVDDNGYSDQTFYGIVGLTDFATVGVDVATHFCADVDELVAMICEHLTDFVGTAPSAEVEMDDNEDSRDPLYDHSGTSRDPYRRYKVGW